MPFEKITSLQNPRVKNVVQLRERRQRNKQGATIIEGRRELERAIEADVVFKEFYWCPKLFAGFSRDPIYQKILSTQQLCFEVSKEVYAKMTYGEREEGLLGIGTPKYFSLDQLNLESCPLVLVIEDVEKPGNLGAILRTCDGAGVSGLIVCDEKTDIFNPNVIRASLGAIFSVPVTTATKTIVWQFLKNKGIKIVATSPQASLEYPQFNFKQPVALVVGSEQLGLSDFWLNKADVKIKIPMFGKVDSLNVSTSTAIILYEAIRQRR